MPTYYLMKVKGNSHRLQQTQTGGARIPDYIQLRDEQMTLQVQRVSGSRHGNHFFPQIAGVGLSRNP